MRRLLAAAAIASLMIVFGGGALFLHSGGSIAQSPVRLGADADPAGNSSTSLGSPDACVSVNTGDVFDFDIFVSNVDELVHWELYIRFDPSIIEVVDKDMRMFLNVNSYSSVKTESASYSDGREFLGAADLRGAPESGDGVLARLTLRAVGPGLSTANILPEEGDAEYFGPRLTTSGGIAIGDVTGDGVFDGSPHDALIAVDESCDTAPPAPTPTPPPGGGTAPPDAPPEPLPVPGDPTFEPPTDEGPASESDPDSAADGEPEDPSADGTAEDDTEAAQADGDDDAEDDSAPAVLAGAGTPGPESEGGSQPVLGGDSSPSSSDGGLPLWAIGLIAAAVLTAAAGASVVLAARSTGR